MPDLPMHLKWVESTLLYYFPTWNQLEIHLFDVPRNIFNTVPAVEPERKIDDAQPVNTWSVRITDTPSLKIYFYTHEPPQEKQP